MKSKCEGGDNQFYQIENGWMETYTGKQFFFANPPLESIDIADIAHALGNLCRYGGHSQFFYSVAEHCCLMADWVYRNSSRIDEAGRRHEAFAALMHDATEGYLVDMPRPIKYQLAEYKVIEDKLEQRIAQRFELEYPMPAWLKELDSRIIRDERPQVMSNSGNDWGTDVLKPLGVRIQGWDPAVATREFLDRYFRLRYGETPA